MKAKLRQVRISSKKVNLIASLVRGMMALEAIQYLEFVPKKAARPLMKLLQSAVANAETNFKQKPEQLVIKEIIVNEGPTYKRAVPISRGRRHPILKRTSHISLELTVKTDKSAPKAKAAKPVKAEASKETKEKAKNNTK